MSRLIPLIVLASACASTKPASNPTPPVRVSEVPAEHAASAVAARTTDPAAVYPTLLTPTDAKVAQQTLEGTMPPQGYVWGIPVADTPEGPDLKVLADGARFGAVDFAASPDEAEMEWASACVRLRSDHLAVQAESTADGEVYPAFEIVTGTLVQAKDRVEAMQRITTGLDCPS